MKRKRTWFGVVSLVVASKALLAGSEVSRPMVPGTQEVVVSGPAGQQLEKFMTELAAEGFSGAVLVAKDGNVLLHKGYGLADRGGNVPVATETVFDIGSITKQFTAAAIMKLEADEKLSTTDRISKYFDNVPADKAEITLHHLLTHSAGFDHAYGDDRDVAPRDATITLILGKPLVFTPGSKYSYSNPGFSLLAAIVEKVSGQPYERYLAETFFRPAGMTKTGYRLPAWKKEEMSRNYAKGVDNGPPLDRSWAPDGPHWHLFGNGGILSTTGDMFRWHKALEGSSVLPESAKQKMFKEYVPTERPAGQHYGYGWRIAKTEQGGRLVYHNGGSGFGVWAAFHRFIDDKILVVVMSNSLPVPGNEKEQLPATLWRMVVGAPGTSSP